MGDLRGNGRSTLSTPLSTDWLIESSYHVSNHVIHHPKHIYKATCLMKRKREHKISQFGKIEGGMNNKLSARDKKLLPKKKRLVIFPFFQ